MSQWQLGLVLLVAAPLWAGTMLLDFEGDADLKVWHDERNTTNLNFPVSREPRFATSGTSALCFRTPQWQTGRGEWPAVECNPALRDWTGYDRLYFAVTNVTPSPQTLSLFISDSRRPVRNGLNVHLPLPPSSFQPVVVPLAGLAEHQVDLRDVTVLHFFTTRPPADMVVYLDAMQLLKPGEPLPPVAAGYLKDFAGLQVGHVAALRQRLEEARAGIAASVAQLPAVAGWAATELRTAQQQVDDFARLVERGDPAILQAAQLSRELAGRLATVEARVKLRAEFEPVRLQTRVDAQAPADLVAGFASSMDKVLPRGGPPRLRLAADVSLALARNEKESFQVVVLPCEQAAGQVSVRVSELREPHGATFAASQIQAVPVGYVETKTVPPYGSEHVGWWPDPILTFMRAADVAVGDAQSFWVRLRAPREQPPGVYRGRVEVLVAGRPAYAFDLAVEVYPFTLPDRSPLNLAITFAPEDSPLPATKADQSRWRQSPDYPAKAWKRHRLEWGDFLADYYITYDSLYHHTAPDFEILQRLHQRGQLGMFNLGYYDVRGAKPEEQAAWDASTLKRIKAAYEQAKALGLLDHAYIYGCDENPAEKFPGVQRAAEVLRRECPGALVMTTTYDHSFGTQSPLQSMAAFCPLTPKYDRALADQVRAKGQQVWWYICCGPHHPFANMFIEYPAIDGRLLMGAQVAKYRPDGFLYYEISIWNSQQPITSGPFTTWDPRSWTTYHGDGSWTCVGPDGTPLPTIRLENFRDGLEDYAYAKLLDQTIAAVAALPATARRTAWLTRARQALEVPADLLRSPTEFTRDPDVVYRWRRGLAEALKSSPVPPATQPAL